MFYPKAQFYIGQIITVQNKKLKIESYSHTGRNLIAKTLADSPQIERFVIVLTDCPAIPAMTTKID